MKNTGGRLVIPYGEKSFHPNLDSANVLKIQHPDVLERMEPGQFRACALQSAIRLKADKAKSATAPMLKCMPRQPDQKAEHEVKEGHDEKGAKDPHTFAGVQRRLRFDFLLGGRFV